MASRHILRDGSDVDTLLRKADIAMYAVKDSGRNGVLRFSSAMNTATAERWRLETALHRALERQELVLYYQPKVNVVSGQVVGAEALMRWKRGGELVPPAEFITVAEESGLIVPITEWAVREVCEQMVRWSEGGMPPIPVSVNISGRHIQRANLVEPVQAALAWLQARSTIARTRIDRDGADAQPQRHIAAACRH